MPYPDFPHSLPDFVRQFPNDDACWDYLVKVRWPDGVICPRDGLKATGFYKARRLFLCPKGHQISVTSDTVMHGSHVPICCWFWAAFLVTTHTPGISALQFARRMNLRLETAYMILQKLRAGMVNPLRSSLNSQVEIDESFIGGKKAGPGGRGARGKALVVGAVEIRDSSSGRVRLRKIKSASSESLMDFVKRHVTKGTTVITDGWHGYYPLSSLGYKHIIRRGESSVAVAKQLPHIHRVFGNLKAWLIGTHHGVSPKHLQAYLNEFAFRFNRRMAPMAAFLSVLGIAIHVGGPTYQGIYRGSWVHPNRLQKAI